MRMSPDRLPKQTLYSQLSSGHRKSGRSRLRFKDTIKRNLKLIDIKISSLDHRKKVPTQRRSVLNSNKAI